MLELLELVLLVAALLPELLSLALQLLALLTRFLLQLLLHVLARLLLRHSTAVRRLTCKQHDYEDTMTCAPPGV